jgi:serine/threonine-protein kinase
MEFNQAGGNEFRCRSRGLTQPELKIASAVDIGESACNDSRQREEHSIVMKMMKASIIFALGTCLGFGIAVIGYLLHKHIDFATKAQHLEHHAVVALDRMFNAKGRAARLEHVVPPAPYFPPGAVWTQDISHAPLDPQSSTIIAWLENAGGWGRGDRMQVDFAIRVLQTDAGTPYVPFTGPGPDYADSDQITVFPLPAGGGIEGEAGYHCPNIDQDDCHLIVVDRNHGKLYEAYQANYADNVLTANFVAVWDLSRVYPPSGRGDQCTSADAAGFPMAPLLFNADELASGSINHAIRFILPNPRMRAGVFVHPATHAGGPSGPAIAPPMGAHFRLKSSFDMSQLKPAARVVARAMQKYGMFLSDGGNTALTAQNDADTTAKYADVDFEARDLQALKVTDFEVVDSGKPIPLTDNCVRNP